MFKSFPGEGSFSLTIHKNYSIIYKLKIKVIGQERIYEKTDCKHNQFYPRC
jgi:hypothetical protein